MNGTCLKTLKAHIDRITSAQFSPDGQTILTASWDRTAKLWNLNGTCITTLKDHSAPISSAQFSPDGQTIITTSEYNTAKLWDLKEWLKCNNFLTKEILLTQAVLLNAIYETIVAKKLVEIHGSRARIKINEDRDRNHSEINSSPLQQHKPDEITFDFAQYPHAQKLYDDLPEAIKTILDPFVTKTEGS